MSTLIIIILLLGVVFIAFLAGRKYENKQFVRVGKPIRSTQDILGVFDNGNKKAR
ncbi:MAG: hypothetical protein J6Y25_04670 [Elusimicrobiaceae bacterium]|nr:hypothetical protein [Elusimicrobiaceae bacterium]